MNKYQRKKIKKGGKMKKTIGLITLTMFIGAQVFAGKAWAKENTLTLVGSTTVLPIAQLAAEKFMDYHPEVDISVRGGGSGVGIAALIDGVCDIATSSRPIKAKELKKARAKGVNIHETVIAMDGIAVVVHPSNPVSSISTEKLKAIYEGKITNWKDLGGKSQTIVVISRDVASGTFEVFKELALKGGKTREDALMLASNKAVAQTVSQTPGAIGYIGLGFISPEVKALKVDGVVPNEENVKSGRYKLARFLYMYTNGEPKGLAKRFIDFILSPEGSKIVTETGYLPVR